MSNGGQEYTRRGFVTLCGLAGATTLAGCSGNGGPGGSDGTESPTETRNSTWPMYQYDAGNTGFVPTGTGPSEDVSEQQLQVGEVSIPPRAKDGDLYVMGDCLTAFSSDGSEQWCVGGVGPPLVIGETYIYATSLSDPRSLSVISPQDGEVLDDSVRGEYVSDMVFVNDTLFIGYDWLQSPTIVRAMTAEDGVQWEFDIEAERPTDVSEDRDYFVYASVGPVVNEGIVYVLGGVKTDEELTKDWTLYALSATNGTKQWSRSIAGIPKAQLSVRDGTIYLPKRTENGTSTIQALSTEGGSERWSVNMERGRLSAVAVDNESVYGIADTGEDQSEFERALVYALSTADGGEQWSLELEPRLIADGYYGHRFDGTPIVVDGGLYVTGSDRTFGKRGRLVAVSTTDGSERWRIESDSRFSTSPVVINGKIYVGSEEGGLHVFG